MPEAEDLEWFGALDQYNEAYDKVGIAWGVYVLCGGGSVMNVDVWGFN